MTQDLRRSQFVLTWGPGAILEGQDGPRIIPEPDLGVFYKGSGMEPEDYEIHNQRASVMLLENARIFRLPSNAERSVADGRYLYRTRPFPNWSQCVEHSVIYQSSTGCPRCGPSGSRIRAIRFVSACLRGHLDDVDWGATVRHTKGCPGSSWYYWRGEGGPLSQILVECPKCGQRGNLGAAYLTDWKCRGRYPEREPLGSAPITNGCTMAAKIMQRQATHLRLPHIISLFTTPPAYTALHNLLQMREIRVALLMSKPKSLDDFRKMLEDLAGNHLVPESTTREILMHSWEEIKAAIETVQLPKATGMDAVLREEFNALKVASSNGIPPVSSPPPASRILFEVRAEEVRHFLGRSSRRFRVVPVGRLQAVVVQKGYRRQPVPDNEVGPRSEEVDIGFVKGNDRWYPGAELLGEGIFVMPDNDDGTFSLDQKAVSSWSNAFPHPTSVQQTPAFVWWHTFSHLVLKTLAIDSGYSAASIRERIYCIQDSEKVFTGMILYAVQPGADGTLGGLVGLVPKFDSVIHRVAELADTCSNDPLCLEQEIRSNGHSGASCYACVLASETSCEHRNMWLDRHLLLDDPP